MRDATQRRGDRANGEVARAWRGSRIAALTLSALAALVAACNDEENASPAAPDPHAWADAAGARLEDDFAGEYARYMATLVAEHPVQNLLDDTLVELEVAEDPVDSGLGIVLEHPELLAEVYAARDWAPVFVDDAGDVRFQAQAVYDALAEIGVHGLDPDDYRHPQVPDLVRSQRGLARALAALPAAEPTRAELRALVAAIDSSASATSEDPIGATFAAVFGAVGAENSAVPELWRLHRAEVELGRVAAGNAALLDAALLDGFVGYALVQRNANTDAIDRSLDDDAKHALVVRRTLETIDTLLSAQSAADVDALFASLPPTLPQYAPLLAARARYAEIIATGGWEVVDARSVRRGSSGPVVESLQRRLQREGYWDGEINGAFGTDLEQAVKRYQRAHQLDDDGVSSRAFWASINVSAEERLAQIDLTLQRWRESRIGDDSYYVFVNVPDFHAEVWRDGTRDMRFRIVVGNTQRTCDARRRRMVYENATPLQSAEMTTVVVNPTWTVPRRIVEDELLPHLLEDDTYFDRSGFERVGDSTTVRQLPGGSNPLGQVKFIFPNPHNTYMHDTSRRQYFQFPVRAFSHGCMRVQDPMALAEYILGHDGQWNEREVERTLDSRHERGYTLNTPIPVHIEYYVVRVDDDGTVNFLSDIYRYDRDRLDPDFVANERCDPPPSGARLVLGDGHTVMYRDTEGNRYTPTQWEYVQSGGTLRQRADGSFEDPPPGAVDGAGGVTAGDYGP
ncbi:MAG: L,D-transpeptidase family protein [Myxococcales bacterium]|nr:L,D-transpeptidase family protein [Myxococcales bacterium]MCB9531943.1 L,D-transpeptidase family protein [Myxococcales bacterium]MCB9533911.1 L,D-transpeptidase family protein [Myxococcales bacterium]